jgi:peptidoglycan/xylan/chitin deacetylase (PgdA/CDA1 family)
MLTIVMYHYVRDLPRTRWPRIKGLRTDLFDGQLDYLTRHYTMCSMGDVAAAAGGHEKLPPNACLLTFDDGLIDHYNVVFPRLMWRGLTGCFYPSAGAVTEHKVLDVHKIQFLLASIDDLHQLKDEVLLRLRPYRDKFDIPSDELLLTRHARPGLYDSADVMFLKRLLQFVLPLPCRNAIIDDLFHRHVSSDEATFATELYMNVEQLQLMAGSGMEIGGHGYSHDWLGEMTPEGQVRDIDQSLTFLSLVRGTDVESFSFCYPHGSYNGDTLEILKQRGCALSLTINVGLAHSLDSPLELERLDTNDLPTSGDAPVSKWTERAGRLGHAPDRAA